MTLAQCMEPSTTVFLVGLVAGLAMGAIAAVLLTRAEVRSEAPPREGP